MHGAQYITRTGQCLAVGPGCRGDFSVGAGGSQDYRQDIDRMRTQSSRDGVDLAQCTIANRVAPVPGGFHVLLPGSGARGDVHTGAAASIDGSRLTSTQQAEDNR